MCFNTEILKQAQKESIFQNIANIFALPIFCKLCFTHLTHSKVHLDETLSFNGHISISKAKKEIGILK